MKKLFVPAIAALLLLTGGPVGATELPDVIADSASEARLPVSEVEDVVSAGEQLTQAVSVGRDGPAPTTVKEAPTGPSIPPEAPVAPSIVPPPSLPAGADGPGSEDAAEPAARPLSGLAAGEFAGFASGTVVHADGLQQGMARLANVDLGFSGVTFSSEQIGRQLNELGHLVAPGLEANTGFGRGSGVEVDLSQTLPVDGIDDDDLVALDDDVKADAPPDTGLISREVVDLELDPVVKARILRAQALAQFATTGCVVGTDLAHGLGYLADVDLLSLSADGQPAFANALLSTSADHPERAVSQSVSNTYLKPSTDGGPPFSLVSETRQTIAPVKLFKGTDDEITIELLGGWVLRAFTGGSGSDIHYGPEADGPDSPVLRIFRGGAVTHEVTLQQFLGGDGLVLEVADLVEVAIGEDPRAIGGDATSDPLTTANQAFAAVDVVRVRLLADGIPGDAAHLTDLRIGHMEVGAAVPEGGIACPGIGLAKQADRPAVEAGDRFTWTVTVANPNDCVLTDVDVRDTISTTPGVMYTIISTDPAASSLTQAEIVWNDIGSLAAGQSKELRINVATSENSAAGRFTDKVLANGVCGPAADQADVGVEVPVASFQNNVTLSAPEVTGPAPTPVVPDSVVLGASEERPRTPLSPAAGGPAVAPSGMLPRTGGTAGVLGLLMGLVLLGGGTLLRRLSAR